MFASHLHPTLQLDFHQRVSISCLGSIDDIVVINPPFGTPEEGCQHGFSFNSTNDVLGHDIGLPNSLSYWVEMVL